MNPFASWTLLIAASLAVILIVAGIVGGFRLRGKLRVRKAEAKAVSEIRGESLQEDAASLSQLAVEHQEHRSRLADAIKTLERKCSSRTR